MQRALEGPVQVSASERGYRFTTCAPDSADRETWAELLVALRAADRWGSTDAAAAPEVWAEVEET